MYQIKTIYLKPTLFLEVGTDPHHYSSVGPLTFREMIDLLQHKTPGDAYRHFPMNSDMNEKLLDAIHNMNEMRDEGDDHVNPGDLEWIGVSVRADDKKSGVRCDSEVTNYNGTSRLDLDMEKIGSEAVQCGLSAMKALEPILRHKSTQQEEES